MKWTSTNSILMVWRKTGTHWVRGKVRGDPKDFPTVPYECRENPGRDADSDRYWLSFDLLPIAFIHHGR